MNNSIVNLLRFRTFLLRLALVFGLVFSLTCMSGRLATHIVARAGQPQKEREERKVEPKGKPKGKPNAKPPDLPRGKTAEEKKAEEEKKRLEEELRLATHTPLMKPEPGMPPKKPPEPVTPPTWNAPVPTILLNRPDLDAARFPELPYQFLVAGRITQIHASPGLLGLDLTAVQKINEQFLLDVPMFKTGPYQSLAPKELSRRNLKELFANTSVITAGQLADGTRVLTIIDMPSSFDSEVLVGRMERLPNNTDNTEQVRKIVAEQGQGGRVFFYGNDLPNIDLTSIANDTGVELIRRTNKMRDLVSVQQRLNTIAARGFDPQNAVIVNGLPASPEAVESMGSFVGRAETWLDFRKSIDSVTPSNIRSTSAKKDFFQELQQGDSELLVLVAHSDGLKFYLNGSRVSLKEIEELPDRQERSQRPRLAVIVSCNAGRANSPSTWNRIFRRDYAPLGQLLVDKGFVDKVSAPDHHIDSDEALETFTKALSGVTQSIFKHWNEWVVRFHPRFEVAS